MDKSIINKMFKSYSPRFKPWAICAKTGKSIECKSITIHSPRFKPWAMEKIRLNKTVLTV